jgi:hypothetical protein
LSVYTKLLFMGQITTTLGPWYTVPAGITAVLRDLEVENNSAATDTLLVALLSVPGFGNAYFLTFPTVPNGQSRQWQGRVAIPAGGQLGGNSQGGQWNIVATGYELA